MAEFQLYRSLMFTPGDQPGRMAKALGAAADAVVFDLEDGVAAASKDVARAEIRAMLERLPEVYPPVFIRINHPGTAMAEADLTAVYRSALTGVMIPKTESQAEVHAVASVLDRLGAPMDVELIPMIESARGVRLAYELATASPRVSRLAIGAVDYCLDLGVSLTESAEELFYAQSKMVVESRAAGILPPLDTVWPNVRDAGGLEATAAKARRIGMGGKLTIHPNQVGTVNRIFAPTEAEVDWARRMVAAYAQLQREGKGVGQLDGQLVERPVYLRALHICRLAGVQA